MDCKQEEKPKVIYNKKYITMTFRYWEKSNARVPNGTKIVAMIANAISNYNRNITINDSMIDIVAITGDTDFDGISNEELNNESNK